MESKPKETVKLEVKSDVNQKEGSNLIITSLIVVLVIVACAISLRIIDYDFETNQISEDFITNAIVKMFDLVKFFRNSILQPLYDFGVWIIDKLVDIKDFIIRIFHISS